MPIFSFLGRSSSLRDESDTVTRCLKRVSHGLRRFKKLLGDRCAPGWAFDPGILSSNGVRNAADSAHTYGPRMYS